MRPGAILSICSSSWRTESVCDLNRPSARHCVFCVLAVMSVAACCSALVVCTPPQLNGQTHDAH